MAATPDTALARYLDHLRHELRLASATTAAYGRDCQRLADLVHGTPYASLTGADIRRTVATLHGQGLSPRSLARLLSSWRGLYAWLLRRHEVSANPCAGLRAPRAPRPLPAALSPDEAAQLMSIDDISDAGIADRALLELAYSSGLRVSELTGLNIENLDVAVAQARVTGKGSRTRIVPIGRAAIEAIARWLPVRDRLAAATERALFVNARGRRLSPREVQRRIKRRAASAGLAVDVHPHMLRHSFASHVLQSS